MEKEEHLYKYRLFRNILGFVFKIYYRPTIIDKELIPIDGPIIVCGNHIHLFDQNLACISTKRMLHYLAKKEYFDDKKVKWFFEAAGCIPVNRQIHDDGSKDKAIELLNKGFAVGLFPEGTRNSLVSKNDKLNEIYDYVKDDITYKKFKKLMKKNMTMVSETEYLKKLMADKIITLPEFKTALYDLDNYLNELVNRKIITKEDYQNNILLPIKFGTVSMAQKTGATIIPYGISGKYKFLNNHLNIRFGNPINVPKDMDLETANKLLFNAITNLKIKGQEDIKKGNI